MNYRDFQKRAEQYDRQKRRHYYFMTLRADEVHAHLLKISSLYLAFMKIVVEY